MTWRNSITKIESAPKPAAPAKKPLILIQKQSTWKQSIQKEILDGKDFNFDEHKDKISSLIAAYIDSIKHQIKGEPGIAPVVKNGKNGADGHHWHFFNEETDDSVGKNGDVAIVTSTGDYYQKQSDSWALKGTLKGKDGNNGRQSYIGGGVAQATVSDMIAAAVAAIPSGGGGGTATNIVSTAVDLTLTNQTHVIITGTAAVNISLKSAATATEPAVVKNRSTQSATVNVSNGAAIDDDTSFIIPPNSSFSFVPKGGQYYVF